MEKENEAGYCSPPKESRFKPGQSGNPKGRPKGRKNNNPFDLLIKELESTVKLTDGTKITKAEAAVKHLCNHAASGDFESNRFIFNVLQKHQPATLAKKVFDKLIEEGYLTEEDAKDYLKHGTILNPRAIPKAIAKLYYDVINKKAWASSSVLHIVLLSVIRNMFVLSAHSELIMREINTEYNFWQGFDKALSISKLSEKERAKLIIETEEEREHKRPDKYLYDMSLKAYLFFSFQTLNSFSIMKDACKNTQGYEEAEKRLINDEIKNQALAIKNTDIDALEDAMEYYKNSYIVFSNNSPINERDFAILQEEPTEQELQDLTSWYENKH